MREDLGYGGRMGRGYNLALTLMFIVLDYHQME